MRAPHRFGRQNDTPVRRPGLATTAPVRKEFFLTDPRATHIAGRRLTQDEMKAGRVQLSDQEAMFALSNGIVSQRDPEHSKATQRIVDAAEGRAPEGVEAREAEPESGGRRKRGG